MSRAIMQCRAFLKEHGNMKPVAAEAPPLKMHVMIRNVGACCGNITDEACTKRIWA